MEGLTPEIPILLLRGKGVMYTAHFNSSVMETRTTYHVCPA
jgi:hypothetical protein